MRTECIDPRYGLNPNATYWIYSDDDIAELIRFMESGQTEIAKRLLHERRFALGWQSNK